MNLYELTERLEELRSVPDNGYYGDRNDSFKLGVVMEKLDRLLEDLGELEHEKLKAFKIQDLV